MHSFVFFLGSKLLRRVSFARSRLCACETNTVTVLARVVHFKLTSQSAPSATVCISLQHRRNCILTAEMLSAHPFLAVQDRRSRCSSRGLNPPNFNSLSSLFSRSCCSLPLDPFSRPDSLAGLGWVGNHVAAASCMPRARFSRDLNSKRTASLQAQFQTKPGLQEVVLEGTNRSNISLCLLTPLCLLQKITCSIPIESSLLLGNSN